jgi:hypothetical protein
MTPKYDKKGLIKDNLLIFLRNPPFPHCLPKPKPPRRLMDEMT